MTDLLTRLERMADTKHAKLCKAVESAYSGILLKEEQADIVNAVLAELRAWDYELHGMDNRDLTEWQAKIDAIGDK